MILLNKNDSKIKYNLSNSDNIDLSNVKMDQLNNLNQIKSNDEYDSN